MRRARRGDLVRYRNVRRVHKVRTLLRRMASGGQEIVRRLDTDPHKDDRFIGVPNRRMTAAAVPRFGDPKTRLYLQIMASLGRARMV